MIHFNVFVRTSSCHYAYSALHKCAADAIADAIDLFGPCYVSVKVKQ